MEIGGRVEVLVDAGEPEVGDLVEATEPLQDGQAELLARHFAAEQPELVFDLEGQVCDLVVVDGAPGRRDGHAGLDLGSVERHPVTRALDHDERQLLTTLERGEPVTALEALAATADGRTIIGKSRVDHLVIEFGATRTTHGPDATAAGPDLAGSTAGCADNGADADGNGLQPPRWPVRGRMALSR